MKIFTMLLTTVAASTAVLLGAVAAQAAEVAALSGDNTISIVNTDTKKVTKTWKIDGVSGRVLGIDVRPADSMLYAVVADGTVYTVDIASGKAAMKSKLEKTLTSGTSATIDFNPVADRLRLIGSDGMNLRANVDDGKVTVDGELKFAETDMHKGEKPNVVAGAYTNSVKGTKETALYDIDATIGGLLKQAPPNDGVLSAVGKLGIDAKLDMKVVAFDIWSDGQGKNEAWLMAGDWLHSVDLATGKATPAVQISGVSGIRDIAILPSAAAKPM
jgi:WD40 repeat protein